MHVRSFVMYMVSAMYVCVKREEREKREEERKKEDRAKLTFIFLSFEAVNECTLAFPPYE